MTNPTSQWLRVLLCLSSKQNFYDANDADRVEVKTALRAAFWKLGDRFAVRVLGSMDDDLLSHGASQLPHYRAYILMEARDFETVVALCQVVKEVAVGSHRLWRYVGIDARVGRPLPFVEI